MATGLLLLVKSKSFTAHLNIFFILKKVLAPKMPLVTTNMTSKHYLSTQENRDSHTSIKPKLIPRFLIKLEIYISLFMCAGRSWH